MELFKTSKDFKGQSYGALKKQQIYRGVKFIDDEFPVETMSIGGFQPDAIEFKRPTEMVEFPCLESKDAYFGLRKGCLDNFNIILGFMGLKYNAKLWSKVFVDSSSQEWNKTNPELHPGIFRIRIWQEGSFFNVTIDDRLPYQKGKLLSTSSSCPSEFWPSLLEKAYAKLLGGYDNLDQVRIEDILMDLTGGVTECVSFRSINLSGPMKYVEFYERLEEALGENTLVILCTEPSTTTSNGHDPSIGAGSLGFDEAHAQAHAELFGSAGPMDCSMNSVTGLCTKYGYLLTRLCAVPKDTTVFGVIKDAFRRDCPIQSRLLRLRGPLTVNAGGGGIGEWKGAYSASSSEWEELGLDVRKRLRLAFDSEAEFWIPLEDVLKHMAGVVLCRLPDTSLISLSGQTWQLNEHHGSWHGHQAGGSLQYRDSFLHNPQYMFDISSEEEEVLLTVIHKRDRDPLTLAIEPTGRMHPIGLGLFKVEANRTTRVHQLSLAKTIYVESAKPYRMVLIHRVIRRGRYVLIPFLEQPLSSAGYLLRLFLPKRTTSQELTMDVPLSSGVTDFFRGTFKSAVQIHIRGAISLLWPDGKNPPSPYCILTCEDGPVHATVRKSTADPIWDEYFIFYRRRPTKVPIVVQIMDKRSIGFDIFLGRCCFREHEILMNGEQEVPLFGPDTKAERLTRMKGSLFVTFYTVEAANFMYI